MRIPSVLLREDADCEVDEEDATAAAKPLNLLINESISTFAWATMFSSMPSDDCMSDST